MPLSLQSLNVALICDGNELETYDVKQEGPNSIRAFVASEAGKVSVPSIPLVTTRRPTVEISNSESCLPTCWIPTFTLSCISTGSAFMTAIYQLEIRVKYWGSKRPLPRSFHSSFRSCNSSVRSPSIPWATYSFLISYRRSRLGKCPCHAGNGDD
jgi:hypothetical protein